MNQNASYTFNLEEWEKKPRKPFNIKKTWANRSKPAVISAGETLENSDDGRDPSAVSSVPLSIPSPPAKDQVTDGSDPHSSQTSLAKSSDNSSVKKTPGSRELRGILQNMPSLRNSPISAHRRVSRDSSRQTSHTRPRMMITPKDKGRRKADTVEKPTQKVSTGKQDAGDDKVVIRKKRSLLVSSSLNKKPKHVKRMTSSSDEESESVSGQTADLWMCSKHVQRRKSDLCEIDIVMSSLRDTGYEIYDESDDVVEQQAVRQVVKKSLESLWKLVKQSAINKNTELELRKVTKELTKSRAELLAKGKERNQELMKLSELQQQVKELARYEEASSSKDIVTKFSSLKQNLPTISE